MIAVYLVECLPGIGLMILLWLRFQRKSLALDLAVLAGAALSYRGTRSFLPFFCVAYLLCLVLEQQRSQSRPAILAVIGVIGTVACVKLCMVVFPSLFRWIVNLCRKPFHRKAV